MSGHRDDRHRTVQADGHNLLSVIVDGRGKGNIPKCVYAKVTNDGSPALSPPHPQSHEVWDQQKRLYEARKVYVQCSELLVYLSLFVRCTSRSLIFGCRASLGSSVEIAWRDLCRMTGWFEWI